MFRYSFFRQRNLLTQGFSPTKIVYVYIYLTVDFRINSNAVFEQKCLQNLWPPDKFKIELKEFTKRMLLKSLKNMNTFTLPFLIIALFLSGCTKTVTESVEQAHVTFDEKTLVVNTGSFQRTWKVTPNGLVTTSVLNTKTGKQWATSTTQTCDWEYYGLLDETTQAKLVSFSAVESIDSGFTSKHLLVEVEFEYPKVETFVKYSIRAYPKAEGVFTQLAFKGNASKYFKGKTHPQGVQFNLVRGNQNYSYVMNGYTNDYIAHYTSDKQRVEYLIVGLDKSQTYKVGLSWWNFKDANSVQNVSVSSVDGENLLVMLKDKNIPSHLKNQNPEEVYFNLPSNVLLDGSFRLIIDKKAGDFATLSEIWVEEQGSEDYYIAGNTDRVSQRKSIANKGFSLVGYLNCGEKNKVEVSSITGRVDFVPVNAMHLSRRYIGYYNDTQHRNMRETPLIKEVVLNDSVEKTEKVEWASVFMLEDTKDVLIMVKESHKCVNQYGYDTGDYEISESGVSNTGTSLSVDEILPNRYRTAWASWLITASNGNDQREFALKRFERIRFPVNTETDVYILANTWGSDRAYEAANESNVLVELESQKSLGIDVQQIDDGYQRAGTGKRADKNGKNYGNYPHPDRYPEGWKNVRQKANELHLKLGLWFPAMPVTLEEMKKNYDTGGFLFYKLDFANFTSHNHLESMVSKIRAYELYTHHKSKVNWDVTENAPRFGYFWAKEYGCVFLENRKTKYPESVVYTPYLVLRDLWHLSKYCNLNKFQGSVQNIDEVDRAMSDAWLHNHPYSAAIPLMSTPLFFQETHFYSPEAKEQIKEVLSAYRGVRNEIYECYVYPIGSEPDNASWSGFQAHHPEKKVGYITLFREIENNEPQKNIQLRFLKNQKVTITNLLTNEVGNQELDSDGFTPFTIPQSAGFLMLKYEY